MTKRTFIKGLLALPFLPMVIGEELAVPLIDSSGSSLAPPKDALIITDLGGVKCDLWWDHEKQLLRAISDGLAIPYEQLTRDLEKTGYGNNT